MTFARELRQAWRSLLQRKSVLPRLCRDADVGARRQRRDVCRRQRDDAAADAIRDQGEVVHLSANRPGRPVMPQRNPLQQMEVPRLRERSRTLARLEGYLLSERVITSNQEPESRRPRP